MNLQELSALGESKCIEAWSQFGVILKLWTHQADLVVGIHQEAILCVLYKHTAIEDFYFSNLKLVRSNMSWSKSKSHLLDNDHFHLPVPLHRGTFYTMSIILTLNHHLQTFRQIDSSNKTLTHHWKKEKKKKGSKIWSVLLHSWISINGS